ncbi:MAG: hypothetical protein ACLFPS_09630 [Clostridia bacterium]
MNAKDVRKNNLSILPVSDFCKMFLKTIWFVFISLFLFIYLYMNAAVWVNLEPPKSVLMTLGKLLYPNIIVQTTALNILFILVIIVLFLMKKKIFRVLNVVLLFVVSLSLINNSVFAYHLCNQNIINAKGEEVILSGLLANKGEAHFNEYDLTQRAKKYNNSINQLTIYTPNNNNKKHTCIVYLPYGNWKIHSDLSIFEYLKNTMLREGYSFCFLSGRTRLETDIKGIVRDLKYGVSYLNKVKGEYGIENIVLSGGSAGGHLALVTANSRNVPEYRIDENVQQHFNVDGVISFYAPVDLNHDYNYFVNVNNNGLFNKLGNLVYVSQELEDLSDVKTLSEYQHRLYKGVLGGAPKESKSVYDITKIENLLSAHTPPTLLIHGTHDSMAPQKPSRKLFKFASGAGYNFSNLELPNVDHAFDTIFPEYSLVTNRAYYAVIKWLETIK